MSEHWKIVDMLNNECVEEFFGTYDQVWQYINSKYGENSYYTVNPV